jgi:hypothetical protein
MGCALCAKGRQRRAKHKPNHTQQYPAERSGCRSAPPPRGRTAAAPLRPPALRHWRRQKSSDRLDYRSYNAFKAQGLCGQPCCTAGVC